MTSPLALISIGATFRGREALAKIKPTLGASFIKLIGLLLYLCHLPYIWDFAIKS